MSPQRLNSTVSTPQNSPEQLCQIITPIGMLGYGFSEDETVRALEQAVASAVPVGIILDSGSTDSGPSKLALGSMTCPRSSYVRDLRRLLRLSQRYHVPLLLASAGGDGSDEHVNVFLDIIRELAEEPEHAAWDLNVLAVFSGIPKRLVRDRLDAGLISGCGPVVPELTHETISDTPRIVAQMGPEPFLEAMLNHPEFNVVVGGRAYDPSPYIAFCAYHARKLSGSARLADLDTEVLGAFTHMGKIMECGGLCASPKSKGAIATIYTDATFEVRPTDSSARCTPLSVAAHTLYEKSRPDILTGPGGSLNLTSSRYEQAEDGVSVVVRGSKFHYNDNRKGLSYTVKLEGARVAGYRTLVMGSFRDPILIPQIHKFLGGIRDELLRINTDMSGDWDMTWHVYGARPDSEEVFVVGEVLAATQEEATLLASNARVYCMHAPYPGQKATSGNFAMGIGGKLELETSECAEFSVYHLMQLQEHEEGLAASGGLFRASIEHVGKAEKPSRCDQDKVDGADALATKSSANSRKPVVNKSKPALVGKGTPRTLIELAKVVRSKNAGPYELTLDVIFDDVTLYHKVKSSSILSEVTMSQVLNIPVEDIVWCGFFDAALAFKVTVPRLRNGKMCCSGGFMETDVHGSQQYIPLAQLKLPPALIEELKTSERH